MPTVLLEGVYKISYNSGGVRCGGVIEGLEQQGQSHHEKSLRLPNVWYAGNRALSRTWETT